MDFSPRIPAATDSYSGTFEMVANYGFCEQIRPLEVLVTPKIEAAITGKLDYCEREIVQLTGIGNGELRAFYWSGPAGFESDSQQMEISSFAPFQVGTYEVIIDNGYCKDTASTMINSLRSPTINLPGLLEVDFCSPVKLRPIITGDDQVEYSWKRRSGLDCYNCATPTLEVPFLPSYELTVINDLGCADTSEIQVVLDKEQLIYVPNAFSPNFDGRNDYFQLFPYCGINKIKNLEIYNRWGALVYANDEINSLDPQSFWDGRIGGETAPNGVYIWQVELDLVDGTTLRYFGDISLVN
jgi:gliding motility-associated-like protein